MCYLGNDGLLPFIDALQRTTRLCRLKCYGNDFTQLTAARLLAAVRANASLIHLEATMSLIIIGGAVDDIPELMEAEALVAARST